MGMYTEFDFHVRLHKRTPDTVINILRYMVGDEDFREAPELPGHELFNTERWAGMLRSGSYYFAADTHSTLNLKDLTLNVRCNLKNYGGEILRFVDWIKPYCDSHKGEFLGFYRYEEDDQPTLIFYDGWEGLKPWETQEEVDRRNYDYVLQVWDNILNQDYTKRGDYKVLFPPSYQKYIKGCINYYEDLYPAWKEEKDV